MDIDVYITDSKGLIIYDSRSPGRRADVGEDYSQWRDVYLTLKGQYGARSTKDDPSDPTASTLYVASPIKRDGEIIGVITLCKPTSGVNEYIRIATQKVIRVGLVAGLAVIVLGIIISFWLTHPITALTRYAKEVRDGKRVNPPKLAMARELKKLGNAFEQMRDALEGRQYVEQYVQTLTHELKSPVSAIRGAAELLEEKMSLTQRKKFLNNIKNESDRMTGIIQKMLQLASLESLKVLDSAQPVDLTKLLKDVIDSKEPFIRARKLDLHKSLNQSIIINGDEFLLHQALSNLLQNAIDFSPERGVIKMNLVGDDNKVCIIIEDEGPGIPKYAIDKIFDRFYSLPRPNSKRKSTGLGLSLVKEVAELHKGKVELLSPVTDAGGTRSTFLISH